jgi:hypothetical protein
MKFTKCIEHGDTADTAEIQAGAMRAPMFFAVAAVLAVSPW